MYFLSFWVERGLNTTATKIWVRIPNIPAGGTYKFDLLYGNASAPPASSLSNTFLAVIPDLALSYPMNEGSGTTLTDFSGNGRHGTIIGATWGSGYRGYALYFDGLNDYVQIPALNLSSPVTIVGGINLQIPDNDSSPRPILGFVPNYDSNVLRRVLGNTATRKFAFVHTRAADNKATALLSATNLYALRNQWVRFGAVLTSDATKRVYINGVKEAEASGAGVQRYPNVNPINTVGRWNDYYFLGAIDELRIFLRALSDDEIYLLHTEMPFEIPDVAEAVGKTLVRRHAPLGLTYSIGVEREINADGWRWARQIIVSNPNSVPLSDYQLLITIDTQTPISQGKMRLDGADIRFATELPAVRVYVSAPSPPAGHYVMSSPTQRFYSVMPPYLESGVTVTYGMFAEAITWSRRRAVSLVRFLSESAVQDRRADAHGWLATTDESTADAQAWFVSNASAVLADAKAPFGIEDEKVVDAKGWFAEDLVEALVDAFGAFATPDERVADALVFFGTLAEAYPDARLINLHISDVSKIQEFIANFIPEIWGTKEWGVLPIVLRLGEAKRVSLPAQHMEKGILYLAKGEWWLVSLPNDATEAIVYNQSHPALVAFVFFYLQG